METSSTDTMETSGPLAGRSKTAKGKPHERRRSHVKPAARLREGRLRKASGQRNIATKELAMHGPLANHCSAKNRKDHRPRGSTRA
jgi:hypothetical protein